VLLRLSYFSPIRPGRSISSARLIDGPEAGVPDCPDIVGFELDGIFRDGEFKDEDTLMGVSILLDLLINNGVRSVLIGADAKTIDEARELLELDTGNPDLVQSLEAVVNPDNCVSESTLEDLRQLTSMASPKILIVTARQSSVDSLRNQDSSSPASTCLVLDPDHSGEESSQLNGEFAAYTYAVNSLFELRALLTCQISATFK